MQLTEHSVVFSAIALPLTYIPILIVANDREYMGEKVNGRLMNGAAMVYLVLVVVASVAAIPLMIITGGGSPRAWAGPPRRGGRSSRRLRAVGERDALGLLVFGPGVRRGEVREPVGRRAVLGRVPMGQLRTR